jgi:ATP-dependent Clp protease ATP-binding subunit ClpA
MARVVDKFIKEVDEQLRERRVQISLSDAARAWLAEKGYDPVFGARPLARLIQKEVKDKIVDDLLFGSLAKKGGKVRVDVGEAGLEFQLDHV